MPVPTFRAADRTGDIGDPSAAFKNPDQSRFLQGLIANLRRNFDGFIDRTVATPSIVLLSPGGKSYTITVDDTGKINATLVT